MAREIPYIQALGEAVHQEMARDESVIYFGQNLGLTDEDPFVQAFGNDRVRVTPISETAEIGVTRTLSLPNACTYGSSSVSPRFCPK